MSSASSPGAGRGPGGTASTTLPPAFPSLALEKWQEEAGRSLDGRSPWEALSSPTWEGIPLRPLYTAADIQDLAHAKSLPGQRPHVRGAEALRDARAPWLVRSDLTSLADPALAGDVVRRELAGGASSLGLLLDQSSRSGLDPDDPQAARPPGRGGLSLACSRDLTGILEHLDPEMVSLELETGAGGLAAAALLLAATGKRGLQTEKLRGTLGMDPLAELASQGILPAPLVQIYDEMALLVRWTGRHAPGLRVVQVSARPYHEAGGSAVHELAFAVAAGVEILVALTDRGIDPDRAAASIGFTFGVGSRLLVELAKLRAARLLWDQVAGAFGCQGPGRAMLICACTSARNKAARDMYTNLLRATIETFTAVAAGAQSIAVAPLDEPAGTVRAESRRLARNICHLLEHEALLDRVVDPAGGSWAIESLTADLAREAWSLLQEVERRGGLVQALEQGFVQQQVHDLAARRQEAVATGQEPLVGVSLSPDPGETGAAASASPADAVRPGQKRAAALQALRRERDSAAVQAALQILRDAPLADPSMSSLAPAIDAAAAGATLQEITCALRHGPGGPGPGIRALRPGRASRPFEDLQSRAAALQACSGDRPRVYLACIGPPALLRARVDFCTALLRSGGLEVQIGEGLDGAQEAAGAALASAARVVAICSVDELYPELVVPLARQLKEAAPDLVVLLCGRAPQGQEGQVREAGVEAFLHAGANRVELLDGLLRKLEGAP